MGSINIIKPLFTVLSSVDNKSQLLQEKYYWKCQDLNPGRLGEKQVCYLCAIHPPLYFYLLRMNSWNQATSECQL